jgi:hypothetical protein
MRMAADRIAEPRVHRGFRASPVLQGGFGQAPATAFTGTEPATAHI